MVKKKKKQIQKEQNCIFKFLWRYFKQIAIKKIITVCSLSKEQQTVIMLLANS